MFVWRGHDRYAVPTHQLKPLQNGSGKTVSALSAEHMCAFVCSLTDRYGN